MRHFFIWFCFLKWDCKGWMDFITRGFYIQKYFYCTSLRMLTFKKLWEPDLIWGIIFDFSLLITFFFLYSFYLSLFFFFFLVHTVSQPYHPCIVPFWFLSYYPEHQSYLRYCMGMTQSLLNLELVSSVFVYVSVILVGKPNSSSSVCWCEILKVRCLWRYQ